MAKKRAQVAYFRKKRLAALALLIIVVILFYNSGWLERRMYPIPYRDTIESVAPEYHVDPFLIAAIIRVESNSKSGSLSHKGAIGLMQIMPDTADWIFGMEGFRSYTLSDLQKPEVNIRVGAKYVEFLNRQFLNNYAEVAAAYNAGQGTVLKWRQTGRWDGTVDNAGQIPFKETRNYVESVDYYYKKYVKIYSRGGKDPA